MPARSLDHFVAWVSRRKLYSVVVLGPEAVGKTTLLNSWRGTWREDAQFPPTQAIRPVGTARLKADGRRLMLPDLQDEMLRERNSMSPIPELNPCLVILDRDDYIRARRS